MQNISSNIFLISQKFGKDSGGNKIYCKSSFMHVSLLENYIVWIYSCIFFFLLENFIVIIYSWMLFFFNEKWFLFFSIWAFFHNHSRITGLQGKREGNPLVPHYHFHSFHRHLDSSWAIAAESSPLYIGSSRTRNQDSFTKVSLSLPNHLE